jgi:hypothetical protein
LILYVTLTATTQDTGDRTPGYVSTMQLLVKAVVSAVVIVVASEVAKRSSLLGAVIVSLPLTSILAMVWLYRDTQSPKQVSDLSWSILYVIAPSVVFFIALPLGLRARLSFPVALLAACLLTAVAYGIWVAAARALGIKL